MGVLKKKWSELDVRTKIAYITAIAAFILGWGMTIAGFCVPPIGEVTDSVLWILGQGLVYAASVFGVGMYTVGSIKGMRQELKEFMQKGIDNEE